MDTHIELGGGELMRQAQMTARDYMLSAVDTVDEVFGAGTATKHPALVAAYMNTAAMDFGAAIIAKQIRSGLETIATVIARREDA